VTSEVPFGNIRSNGFAEEGAGYRAATA